MAPKGRGRLWEVKNELAGFCFTWEYLYFFLSNENQLKEKKLFLRSYMQNYYPTYQESVTFIDYYFSGVVSNVASNGGGMPDPVDLNGKNVVGQLLEWGKYIEANGGKNSELMLHNVIGSNLDKTGKNVWESAANGWLNMQTGSTNYKSGDRDKWVISRHDPVSNYNNTLADVWSSQLSNGTHVIHMGIYGQDYHSIQIKTANDNLYRYFFNYIGIVND